MTRTYNQDCILAYALDLLGERWTLLILRELLLGPRRFGDIHAALPGLGTNLLSKRLKELDEAGLIETTPGDGHSRYRIAEAGEKLRQVINAIMLWSIHYFMERPDPSPPRDCIYSDDLQPDSVALALAMFANKCACDHSNYVIHLILEDNPYTLFFMNGEMTARRGADSPAVARIETDVATMMKAMRGEMYLSEIAANSSYSGDQDAIDHLLNSIVPGADVAADVARKIAAGHRG